MSDISSLLAAAKQETERSQGSVFAALAAFKPEIEEMAAKLEEFATTLPTVAGAQEASQAATFLRTNVLRRMSDVLNTQRAAEPVEELEEGE